LPLATIATGTAASGAWSFLGEVLAGVAGGGLVGGAVAFLAAPIAAIVGGGHGAVQATKRVAMENGAAKELAAQVEIYKAQAQSASNDNNKYNFPAQGSAMNPAMASIQADSAQAFGPVAGQSLQRA
jgi:hypothetical protein